MNCTGSPNEDYDDRPARRCTHCGGRGLTTGSCNTTSTCQKCGGSGTAIMTPEERLEELEDFIGRYLAAEQCVVCARWVPIAKAHSFEGLLEYVNGYMYCASHVRHTLFPELLPLIKRGRVKEFWTPDLLRTRAMILWFWQNRERPENKSLIADTPELQKAFLDPFWIIVTGDYPAGMPSKESLALLVKDLPLYVRKTGDSQCPHGVWKRDTSKRATNCDDCQRELNRECASRTKARRVAR